MRRTFSAALLLLFSIANAAPAADATAVIHGDQDGGKISRHLYGHFAEHLGRCVYDGLWVGEDSSIPNTNGVRTDVIDALKAIQIPNLRWPGGCYADDYHWRDGIGPKEERPKRINIHWGQVIDTNAFGTHEFLDLCERARRRALPGGQHGQRHAPGDFAIGSSTSPTTATASSCEPPPQERPRGAVEAHLPRRRQRELGLRRRDAGRSTTPTCTAGTRCSARNFSGNRLIRIACGPSGFDAAWNKTVMEQRAGRRMQGYSIHYYTLDAPVERQAARHRVRRGRVDWSSCATRCRWSGHHPRVDRRDGRGRPRQADRPVRRRVGHLVRRRGGHAGLRRSTNRTRSATRWSPA